MINEAGKYEATVKALVIDESNAAKPCVILTYQTDTGGEISSWNYLHGGAWDVTLKMLREAFGFDDNFDTIEGQVVGKRCVIVVEPDTYNGKTRMRVKFTNRLGGAQIQAKPAGAGLLAKLSSQAKRTPRPADMPKPAPKPTAKPAPNPETDDNNLPF